MWRQEHRKTTKKKRRPVITRVIFWIKDPRISLNFLEKTLNWSRKPQEPWTARSELRKNLEIGRSRSLRKPWAELSFQGLLPNLEKIAHQGPWENLELSCHFKVYCQTLRKSWTQGPWENLELSCHFKVYCQTLRNSWTQGPWKTLKCPQVPRISLIDLTSSRSMRNPWTFYKSHGSDSYLWLGNTFAP